ncbi:MAG: protein phosphatase 2C domain-containing protein [Verrucomicrobiota bacterium]
MNPPGNLPPTPRLQWFGRTDPGKVRRNNEDAFLGLQFNDREIYHLGKLGEASLAENDFVFAVSDGMGGARAGEFASRLAVDKITRLLPRSFKQAATGLVAGYDEVLTELFDRIHRALVFLGESDEECSGMGATLSLCWFTPEWMYFAHIGDSRIYYLPASGGGIMQITQDDTHVGWLFRNDKLNEREAKEHPRRNVLQKALGAGHQFVDPQVGKVGYEAGDVFLLCTDGLTDGLYNSRLEDILRTQDQNALERDPAKSLLQAALELAARDNITALVVEVV